MRILDVGDPDDGDAPSFGELSQRLRMQPPCRDRFQGVGDAVHDCRRQKIDGIGDGKTKAGNAQVAPELSPEAAVFLGEPVRQGDKADLVAISVEKSPHRRGAGKGFQMKQGNSVHGARFKPLGI